MNAGLVKGEGFAVDASVMEADASRYHGQAPGEIDWPAPERQTRAVAGFLSGLDDEDPNEDRKLPKVISPTDPCSVWTAKANKRVQFGYGLNYMIDVEHAVIVDGAPQIDHPAIDFQIDFVQMLSRMEFGSAFAQVRCDHRPEMVHPAPDGLVGDRDPAFRQQIFDVAEAQREPNIEPDRVLDDFGWKAIAAIADFDHRGRCGGYRSVTASLPLT